MSKISICPVQNRFMSYHFVCLLNAGSMPAVDVIGMKFEKMKIMKLFFIKCFDSSFKICKINIINKKSMYICMNLFYFTMCI